MFRVFRLMISACTATVFAVSGSAVVARSSAGATPIPSSPKVSTLSVNHGPPGYTMTAPKRVAAATRRSSPATSSVINASYTHVPAPNAQPDLPQGSGPTMHELHIYEVFWLPSGHFGANAADDTTYENLLQQFAGDLGGTAFYNLVTQYYDHSNSDTHITNTANLAGTFVDTATAFPHAGTTTTPLTEGDVTAEVAHAVAVNGWAEDLNHIVAVFTPNGIQECDSSGRSDGHCTFPVAPSANSEFCAYHSHFNDGATDTLFAYMSYDDQFHGTGQTCVAGQTGSDTDPNRGTYPNGNRGADAEVSTFSHELIEAATDPRPNAAWTATDGEIGDKCNFSYTPRNDLGADVYLNGHPYIVQQEFSNAVHTCAIDLCGGGVCAPSVSFAKTVNDPTPKVGTTVTYTLTLNNTDNTGAATNLTVTDTVPSGYAVTGVNAPSSTSSSNTASSVTVNYDTLPVHQSRSISITATVPAQAGTVATNCGSLTLQNLLGAALTSQTTSPCAITTPRRIPTTLVSTGATTQDYNDPATVSAKLFDDQSNPIAGQAVTFTLNGTETCTANTDGFGDASCPITPGEPAAVYPLVASFAGSTVYDATSVTSSFTVTREETTTKYTGPTIIANLQPATLSGVLLEDGITPIAGRVVTLSLGTGVTKQSCGGTTDISGTATCTIASVAQPLGAGTATAAFAGDAFYVPSSDAAATILFQYTDGGSFVVGNATVGPIVSSVGTPVTFWGATWHKLNALSGGAAPPSFKGFENSQPIPMVGTAWAALPGNSTPPPATVPSYTAMIVSSAIVKMGPVIAGSDVHIVIVRTDRGYGPEPGSRGTGTIVAVLS